MQFRWHLQNGMHENIVHMHLIHFCDEQPQVAVKESALIVTSLECHNNINLQPQSEGDGGKHFQRIEN